MQNTSKYMKENLNASAWQVHFRMKVHTQQMKRPESWINLMVDSKIEWFHWNFIETGIAI